MGYPAHIFVQKERANPLSLSFPFKGRAFCIFFHIRLFLASGYMDMVQGTIFFSLSVVSAFLYVASD
jgi:hypothetical protein